MKFTVLATLSASAAAFAPAAKVRVNGIFGGMMVVTIEPPIGVKGRTHGVLASGKTALRRGENQG